jgi:cadmium resistance protein CadD (predicted permease)
MISTALLAAVLFATTDIDDLLVLVVLFADPKRRRSEIVVGQYLGMTALFLASLAVSAFALVVPERYVGLAGLLPILIGVKELIERWRGEDDDDEDEARNVHGALAVAAITIANGGDNIAVYTPLLATSGYLQIAVIAGVFAIMTGVWLEAAHWLTRHPSLGAPIRRYGHAVTPFALMALGLAILYRSGALAVL